MVVYEIIAHVISHTIDVHKRIKGIIGQCLVLLFFLKLLINFTVSVTPFNVSLSLGNLFTSFPSF